MFVVAATTHESVEQVWTRLTDFAAHAQGVPLTTTRTDPDPPTEGWTFTPRTSLGPLGFDDPMVVTVWEPPTRFRVEKTGRVLAGWADVTLDQLHRGGTRVTWTEEVVPAHATLARLTRPLFDAAGRLVFGRALRRMLAGS